MHDGAMEAVYKWEDSELKKSYHFNDILQNYR